MKGGYFMKPNRRCRLFSYYILNNKNSWMSEDVSIYNKLRSVDCISENWNITFRHGFHVKISILHLLVEFNQLVNQFIV